MAIVGISTDEEVIDADYRGPIKVILINRHKWNTTTINKGDRIAQLTIIKIYTGPIKEVQELTKTARDQKGFGSTGVNAVMESKRQEPKPQDKHAYVLGDKLTEEQKKILQITMKKYEDILATNFEQISHKKEPKFFHDIELIEEA